MLKRLIFGSSILLMVGVAHAEHTLTVHSTSVEGTTVYLDGYVWGSEALGMAFEARICDANGDNPTVGSQHTFTALQQPHRFSVENVPSNVLSEDFVVSVTDDLANPSCQNGSNGYLSARSAVASNRKPTMPVPALPLYGLVLLGGLLGLLGARRLNL